MASEFRRRCDDAAESLGRTSLVVRLTQSSGTEAIRQALESGRPRLGAWASVQTAALPEGDRRKLVEQFLDGTPVPRLGVLNIIIASPAGTWPDSILCRIEAELNHPVLAVAVAAGRCLAKHAPERLPRLIRAVERRGGSDLARMFCLSGNDELIRPLVEYSDRRLKALLPSIGWLVTPQWLARNYEVDAALTLRLAESFGYLDGDPNPAVLEMLAEGWSFVSMTLVRHLAERTEDRRRLTRALVPTALATSEHVTWGEATDPLWRAILIAATRDADRSNLQESLERSPFDPRTIASPQIAVAMHAPARYLQRVLIDEPLTEAARLDVDPAALAEFLVDSARVTLETLEEPRAELQIATLAKWRARSRLGARAHHLRIERFPILTDDDAPDLKSVVLGKRLATRLARKGSPGMESISRMALQAGLTDPSPILSEIEEFWGRTAPTFGIELQVPLVDRDVSLCWKQAMRSLGTPSPRRPEYFQTVEASFPPARGIASLILGPLLLRKLGLISRPQEMALHISIGGDLGDQANDLAFLLYFVAMGRQQRTWPAGMKWVLSKGLVHFHPEAESLGSTASGRTEVRVLRCFALEDSGDLKLDRAYIDQMVAAALLATAMLSSDGKLKAIHEMFRLQLTQLVETLPESFRDLRHASFYDSTGDGNDPDWLESLPIVRSLSRVRESLQTPGVREQVAKDFRCLRDDMAARITGELGLKYLPPSVSERDTYRTACGLPLFIPAELQELLASTSC